VFLLVELPKWLIPAAFSAIIILIPFGILVGSILQEAFGMGARFSKYVAAGLLSFSIDFGTLNVISYLTGITAGIAVGWINIPGFILGLTNAYLWNKLWVFQKSEGSHWNHFPKFLFVVIIGMLINSFVVVWITSTVPPPFWTSGSQWLNIAKLIATCIAIIWNFFGYKFIAFR